MDNAAAQSTSGLLNVIEHIAVADLRFDRASPRFAGFGNDLPDDNLDLIG